MRWRFPWPKPATDAGEGNRFKQPTSRRGFTSKLNPGWKLQKSPATSVSAPNYPRILACFEDFFSDTSWAVSISSFPPFAQTGGKRCPTLVLALVLPKGSEDFRSAVSPNSIRLIGQTPGDAGGGEGLRMGNPRQGRIESCAASGQPGPDSGVRPPRCVLAFPTSAL